MAIDGILPASGSPPVRPAESGGDGDPDGRWVPGGRRTRVIARDKPPTRRLTAPLDPARLAAALEAFNATMEGDGRALRVGLAARDGRECLALIQPGLEPLVLLGGADVFSVSFSAVQAVLHGLASGFTGTLSAEA